MYIVIIETIPIGESTQFRRGPESHSHGVSNAKTMHVVVVEMIPVGEYNQFFMRNAPASLGRLGSDANLEGSQHVWLPPASNDCTAALFRDIQ